MRRLVVLALVVLPSTGLASPAEDRYGPPASYAAPAKPVAPHLAAAQLASSSYNGPFLHWSGKSSMAASAVTDEPPAAPPPPLPVSRPAPASPTAWAPPVPAPERLVPPPVAARPPAPLRPLAVYTPSPVRPAPAPRVQPAATLPAPLPQSLYARTPRSPAVDHRTAAVAEAQPSAPALVKVASKPSVPAPIPAAPAQVAMAAPPPAPPSPPVRAHFYSLHRDYGDAPDPIALPTARPDVLIGPPDAATAPTDADPDKPKPATEPGVIH